VNESSDPEDVLLRGLGRVVRAASQLDHSLRTLFCALVGSKYAAVVAAGQPMEWLHTSCMALLKAHREMAPEHKEKLAALLRDAKAAADRRNRLVHDLWGYSPNGMFLVRSRRGTHERAAQPVTLEEIESVERDLAHVSDGLDRVVANTLGGGALLMEAQLRWEDYLLSLSPEELAALAERRKQALLDMTNELYWEDHLFQFSSVDLAALAERYRRALLDKERGASGDPPKDASKGD
jgi:hypothetical protein